MKFLSGSLPRYLFFVLLMTIGSAEAADLSGIVMAANGDPVAHAHVTLIELRDETITDESGFFRFDDAEPGVYLLEANSLAHGGSVMKVEVSEGMGQLTVVLDQRVHAGLVSVTATGRVRGLDQVIASVDVLADDELTFRLEPTLGDTLARQAGVSATGYGRGASRPVIRGLSADRIRVLENGLDSGDVSSIGPDHATAVDPLSAESIEVVRGPAVLLYGGTAVGGVVNVLDGRVPDRVPGRALAGEVRISGGSNSDELSGSAAFDGGVGDFAWHVEGFARDADDYSSPARRPVEEEPDHEGDGGYEFETGRVENSFVETGGGALGLSWVGSRGFVGLAYSLYDSDYGVPGDHHHEEGKRGLSALDRSAGGSGVQEGEGVNIDLEQRRLDVHARLDEPFPGVDAMQFRIGWRDYQHTELEGTEIGTRFKNDFLEARIEALLDPLGGFDGVAGLHWFDRDFEAFGEEAFVQPTSTKRIAAFIFEELEPRPWGVQAGLRGEIQDTDTIDPDLPARSFSSFSASAGVTYAFSEVWGLNVTVSHSERAPTAEELYSDGPHVATSTYEIGDADLTVEKGNGLDLTLKMSGERVNGSASVFRTRFSDFIYLTETGMEMDGLEVRVFSAGDAEFKGFELHGDVELFHGGENHVHLEATYDRV
ncbi:MAG: TonB-dependent receptor, partial [Acidobacteriota bacterium]